MHLRLLQYGLVVFPTAVAFVVEDSEYKHCWIGMKTEWEAPAAFKILSKKR